MTLEMRLIGILGIALSCLAIGGGGMRWFQAHQAAAFAAGDAERQAQVKDLQGEVLQLRAAIASTPRELHWGVSVTGGTNQTLGGGVEYSRGIVFAGVDVVRRQLAGGQTTLEALGRVGFHF